jgi:hypothetical protein
MIRTAPRDNNNESNYLEMAYSSDTAQILIDFQPTIAITYTLSDQRLGSPR